MPEYDWNPYKDEKKHSHDDKNREWNYDPRDESFYLGKVNQTDNTDPDMRYYTDGETGRFYRKNEIGENRSVAESIDNPNPYRNNDFYGSRNRNYDYEGPHKGKGPRNPPQDEESVLGAAAKALKEDSLVDATNIELKANGDLLILNGSVRSAFEKNRAGALVEYVGGIRRVENNLKVKVD